MSDNNNVAFKESKNKSSFVDEYTPLFSTISILSIGGLQYNRSIVARICLVQCSSPTKYMIVNNRVWY